MEVEDATVWFKRSYLDHWIKSDSLMLAAYTVVGWGITDLLAGRLPLR